MKYLHLQRIDIDFKLIYQSIKGLLKIVVLHPFGHLKARIVQELSDGRIGPRALIEVVIQLSQEVPVLDH
jgi:hypothetical protein